MINDISRRQFLKGAAAGAVGIAVAGLAGCAQTGDPVVTSAPTSAEAPLNVSQTLECDVVIVGAGISGLAAAVQSGEDGLNAIVLEAGNAVGGNGNGVEGIFGYNTSAQKAQGMEELDPGAIVRHELETGQHLPDGVIWADLMRASTGNYDWLVEQGVTFSGRIDAYGGLYPTMHWFEGEMAAVGYVPAMEKKAQSYGVNIMLETTCKNLIFDEAKVTGVYAHDADGNYIQINAKAVVLATGGFGYNDELLERWGYNMECVQKIGNPRNNGDGIRIAIEVGAQDCTADACFLSAPNIDGLFGKGQASGKLCFGGPFLWVNKDGNRFVNEDLAGSNIMSCFLPGIAQKYTYCVADSAIIEAALSGEKNVTSSGGADAETELNDVLVKCPSNNIYKADSLSELAGKFDIDADALQATVDRYNELCQGGKDLDFGKVADAMVPITTAPYYMYRLDPAVLVAIGGLGTNRNMQVIDDASKPIQSLYAIGVDGVRLYRKVYPINIAATCCGHNVNSGRTAIRHIKANI